MTSRFAGIGSVKALIVLAVAVAVATLTGCADSRGGPIPYDVGTFSPPDPTSIAPLEEDYKIAPLDVLSIKVFKMEDLSGEYDVDLTGHISLPLVGASDGCRRHHGRVGPASDRVSSASDISRIRTSASGSRTSTRRSVTVDGAVKQAGSFPVNGPMTLMQAVVAGRRHVGRRQRPPRRNLSANPGTAAGRGIRFDQHSPRRGSGPEGLSGRYRRDRWIGDQGRSEADPEHASRVFNFPAFLI